VAPDRLLAAAAAGVGTALILTVQPLGTLLLGVALLDESPSTGQVVGALVLLAGVVVAQVGRRPAPAAV
jgi:drug/metabolite transporter (DMT)-like permease